MWGGGGVILDRGLAGSGYTRQLGSGGQGANVEAGAVLAEAPAVEAGVVEAEAPAERWRPGR
jgi:hypothetical protein